MNLLAIVIPLLLSSISLIINHIAQPPTNLRPKVFVVGLSKTGTTSVGNALALLGYRRMNWKDVRSRQLVHSFMHGEHGSLIELTKYYDAFEDLPWPFMYEELAEMYPDAKFILSLRKDEQTWLRSMQKHQSRGVWAPAVHFYGSQDTEGDREVVLNAYRNHTANVRRFFQNMPERYVELVVDDAGEVSWERVCRVAQCPPGGRPAISFPKSNTVASWKDDSFVGSVHAVWRRIMAGMEEALVEIYYHRDWSWPKTMLERGWQVVTKIEMACCNLYWRHAGQNGPALGLGS